MSEKSPLPRRMGGNQQKGVLNVILLLAVSLTKINVGLEFSERHYCLLNIDKPNFNERN